jgi:hypothetical protein
MVAPIPESVFTDFHVFQSREGVIVMSIKTTAMLFGSVLTLGLSALVFAGSPNGSAGDMPAFYDGELFTINFKELPSGGESAVLAQNGQINTIYMSDQAMAAGFDFVSVLDAIQGDGFNPLWREVQIVFASGVAPFQLESDTDVLAAAAAGLVMLVPTDEVYRCSVVGPK